MDNPRFKRTRRVVFWLLVLVYVPFCMALLAVKWLVLPEIDRYRPEIQQFLQSQTGTPIEIGEIKASWRGFGPALIVRDIRLTRPDGGVGLQAERLQLNWSLPSILTFSPRLRNLEVESPTVSVHRNAAGIFEVAGVPFVDDGTEGNPGLDWLLSQRRVLLTDGVLNWQDALGQFPDTQATQAELLLENGLRSHRAGLVFNLPSLAQTPVQAMLNFNTPLLDRKLGDVDTWKGTLHVNAVIDQTDPLETVFKTFGLDVQLLQPQGRLWIDFEGGLIQRSLLDARIANLRFANPQVDAPPFDMSNTSALLEVSGEHALFKPEVISIRHLQGQIAGRQQFGPSDLSVRKSKSEQGVQWGLKVEQLDATQAKAIAMELAPHLNQKERLAQLGSVDFAGRINRVDLNWITAGDTPHENSLSFNSDLDFTNLTVQFSDKAGKTTGFKNISGTFKGTDSQGEWTLSGNNSEVSLPEVFDAASLTFDTVQGQGAWRDVFTLDGPSEFSIQRLEVQNQDLQAEVAGKYEFRRDEADFVDMKGQLVRADMAT